MQEGYIKTLLTGIRRWVNGKLDTKAEIWRGTQAQYDALTSYDNNTFYVIIQ